MKRVMISHHPTLPPDEAPLFIIPRSLQQSLVLFLPRALVRMSAGMSVVGTWDTAIAPSETASLSQKNRRSRCFMRPWCSGFLATDTADILSMCRVEGVGKLYPNSQRRLRNQMICCPAVTAATNSASVVDSVTKPCSLLDQAIGPVPTFTTQPVVDLPLSGLPP